MKISVVTITYNSRQTVEDTIRSVVAQDYPDLEYIIVDGLSTDGTLAIVDKYKDRISKVVSEKDEGLYDALNKGVRHATGEVMGFLHSDDAYTGPQVISKIAACFEKDPGIDGVYAIAKLSLETVAVQQRHEQLEVGLLAVVRRRGEQ